MTERLQRAMEDYGEYCIRVAYLYVKDWAAAEEIVQDVFLAYFQQADRFEGRSSLKTYLVKITIHKSHDYLRSWRRKWQLLFQTKTHEASTEQLHLVKESQSELAEALLNLPVHYREVLILYYYDDFKIADIAKLLDCSENTVKTRLVRGREKLKARLQHSNWEGMLYD